MENSSSELSLKQLIGRFAILIGVALLVGFGGCATVLTGAQATACAVFIGIILGTLFFWNFRLAVAFIGLAVLVLTGAMDIETMVASSSLEVILFLVGMMVVVGALRDLGFFTWIVQLIVSMPNLSGKKFISVTAIASALLACAVDEVTSIIFVSALIFQVCDRLKVKPAPYIMIAVLCTNVGSAGTMMGNPVGIYIGNKGGLSFGDFMIWSFPLMLVVLLATVALMLFIYRRELAEFDVRLRDRLEQGLSLAPVIKVPYKAGLFLIVCTICAIASHHQTESFFGLPNNSVLIIAPLVCAGVVMILRPNRARHYIETEVDWWTLLFFMLLFSIAGTLEHTGVDQVMAKFFSEICGTSNATLIPFVFTTSAIGSAFVDNVIFVAAFSPVIEQLAVSMQDLPLWWALLFGACFGGNITMIGSTANIVALGTLEKRAGDHITFFQWFKVGAVSTLLSGAIAIGGLLILAPVMPDRYAEVNVSEIAGRSFTDKKIILRGTIQKDSDGWKLQAGDAAGTAVKLEAGEAVKAADIAAFNGKLCSVKGVINGDAGKEICRMKMEAVSPLRKHK